jgi:hypothetical protein
VREVVLSLLATILGVKRFIAVRTVTGTLCTIANIINMY